MTLKHKAFSAVRWTTAATGVRALLQIAQVAVLARLLAPTKHLMNLMEKQGVTLHFLPPYSPELNRIDKLWHLMKYTWMSVKCRDSKTLEA
ncbi:MAG: transposase, partial [Giesbergeria sp.]|nr:transposase [Giesbergeria sp.]